MAHEMSVAQGLARAILAGAQRENAVKVVRIDIEIGQLTFLNIEQVIFWLKELLRDSIAGDAEIDSQEIQAVVKCGKCGYQGHLQVKDDPLLHQNLPVFACPQCQKGSLQILAGRDCVVKSIEILQDSEVH